MCVREKQDKRSAFGERQPKWSLTKEPETLSRALIYICNVVLSKVCYIVQAVLGLKTFRHGSANSST